MHRSCRLLLFAPLLISGCGSQPEITFEVQPRVASAQRLLGALVFRDDATWSFKLMGKEMPITAQKEEFEKMVRSVRFESDQPIWDMPAGWNRDDKQPDENVKRFATMVLGPKDKPLECVVHQLPAKGGTVKDNVNRWRMQLGLYGLPESELADFVRVEKVAKELIYIVDMVGPGAAALGAAAKREFAAPPLQAAPGQAGPKPKIKYDLPDGWKEAPLAMFSVATWEIGAGDQKAKVTITPSGGTLIMHIERWRKNMKLSPLEDPAAAVRDVRNITVDGRDAKIHEVANPAGPPSANAQVAVIVPHEPQELHFVLRGPAASVAQHKAAFERFVKSVRFDKDE